MKPRWKGNTDHMHLHAFNPNSNPENKPLIRTQECISFRCNFISETDFTFLRSIKMRGDVHFTTDTIVSVESFPSAPRFRDRGGIGLRHHQARNGVLPSTSRTHRGRISWSPTSLRRRSEMFNSWLLWLWMNDILQSHLLTSRELKLSTTEGLDNLGLVTIARADRHDRLSDANASNGSLWLSESTTHTSLEPER